MTKSLKISKKELHDRSEKRKKRNTIYLSLFFSLCFLSLGFSWYEDIKTKGYYLESKYQVLINGEDGLITIYALLIFGFGFLFYSIYLIFREYSNLRKTL